MPRSQLRVVLIVRIASYATTQVETAGSIHRSTDRQLKLHAANNLKYGEEISSSKLHGESEEG